MQQTENSHLNPRQTCQETEFIDDSAEISIIDLLLVIVSHKKMIIRNTIVAGIVTVCIALLMPNIYTATTLILPAEDDKAGMSSMMAQLGGLAGFAGASIGGATKTDLYITMLKSETVRDPIIDRFKLMDVYKAKLRVDAYNSLNAKAAISAGKKDGIITISVSDKDPKMAAELANGYVEELGKIAAGLSTSGAGKNRQFLEERLVTAKGDLIKAGDQLKTFQAKNKMLNVTEQAKASIEGVAKLHAQLAVQEVQLATLQQQFTDSSHEVKRAKASLASLKSQIAKLEGGGGGSSIPSVGSVPQLGQDYLRIMRDFKVQETMVELLTKQYEMARFSESKDLSPFQVLQKAKVPERKSKPARAKMVILATFTVFFFSLLLAFILESFSKMSDENRERWELLKKGLTSFRKK